MDFLDNSDSSTYWTPITAITSSTINLTGSQDFVLTYNIPYTNPPDVNWMPYEYVEYEPKWHQKYARIKYQMEKMWD